MMRLFDEKQPLISRNNLICTGGAFALPGPPSCPSRLLNLIVTIEKGLEIHWRSTFHTSLERKQNFAVKH